MAAMLASMPLRSLLSRCALLPVLCLPLACGDDSETTPAEDAMPGTVADADPSAPDGAVATVDARVGPDATPNLSMSFFVTSTGSGASGGDLGGLAAADAKCQALATNGGAGGRTWHAYLSTGSTGPGPVVDARDRIGSGPWFNQEGTMIASNVTALHSNGVLGNLMLDELGAEVPSIEHDVLTGTGTDGRLSSASQTCDNWTNSTVRGLPAPMSQAFKA